MRGRIIAVLVLLAVAVPIVATPAVSAVSLSARTLSDQRLGTSKAELVAQKRYSEHVLAFFKHHQTLWASHHATCWSLRSRVRRRTCDRARLIMFTHRKLDTRVVVTMGRLYPSLPYPFWDCVATGMLNGSRVSGGEGGATSLNPAGPFYGRYQMDDNFMKTHGADMLAKYGDRDARFWSVLDQTIVAERGFQSQGAGAWPNTASPCLSLRGVTDY